MTDAGENTRLKGRTQLISPVLRTALLLGVLAHLAGFLIFRVVSNSLPDRIEEPAFLSFIDSESLVDDVGLEEQAMLFDTAPLFIPGRWSSTSLEMPRYREPLSQIFPDFEPEVDLLAELKPGRISIFDGIEVEEPEDMLDLRFWDLFRYFGQGEQKIVPLEDWTAFAEVRVLSSPELARVGRVMSYELDVGSLDGLFLSERPVVFVIGMSASGIPNGSPALKQSSGVDELDSAAQEWLMRPETLASMPAGFLEVRCFL